MVQQTVKLKYGRRVAIVLIIAAACLILTKCDVLLTTGIFTALALLMFFLRKTKNADGNTGEWQSHRIVRALNEVIHSTIPKYTNQFKREVESLHTLVSQSTNHTIRNFNRLIDNCNHEKQKILKILEKAKQLNITLLNQHGLNKAEQELDEHFNRIYRITDQGILVIDNLRLASEKLTGLSNRLLNELSDDKFNFSQNKIFESLKTESQQIIKLCTNELDMLNKYPEFFSMEVIEGYGSRIQVYRSGSAIAEANTIYKGGLAHSNKVFTELSELSISIKNIRSNILRLNQILKHDMDTLASIFYLAATLNVQVPNCLSRFEDINHRTIRLRRRCSQSYDLSIKRAESTLSEIHQINHLIKSLALVIPD